MTLEEFNVELDKLAKCDPSKRGFLGVCVEKRSCGCPESAHPEARNYAEGAAERDGRICRLGWPVSR